jgi:NADPH:quinone reductase-like Zn-dependent oxidoreductase
LKRGDRVATTFFQRWLTGPLTEEAARSDLGGSLEGVLAEYVALHEDGLVEVPPHLSDEEAATLPCAGVTAWNALVVEGRIKAGDTVLVLGTGGVSLFALQLARIAGLRVIATSGSDEKLRRALELGASEGINYRTTPDWEKRVLALTGGSGVELVIEVGGAGTLGKSLRAVRVGGTIALIGILSGSGEVNPLPAIMRGIRIQGIFVGSRAMFEAMNHAIGLHRMRPVIDRVFRFEEAREALRHMESGAHFGKVVLKL